MNAPTLTDDPLFSLELQVARRADELAHREAYAEKPAWEVWCEAEREIFADEANAALARTR